MTQKKHTQVHLIIYNKQYIVPDSAQNLKMSITKYFDINVYHNPFTVFQVYNIILYSVKTIYD